MSTRSEARWRTASLAVIALAALGLVLALGVRLADGATEAARFARAEGTPTDRLARAFVRDVAGVTLPAGVRASYLSPTKVQFRIRSTAVDSVARALGVDSSWAEEPLGTVGTVYRRSVSAPGRETEELFLPDERLYELTDLGADP